MASAVRALGWSGLAALLVWFAGSAWAAPAVTGLEAEAHDSRVDLVWDFASPDDVSGYIVYRATDPAGPFERLNAEPHDVHVYSDFIGENGTTYYYQVTALDADRRGGPRSETVSATPFAMTDDQLLTSIQKAAFRYFWHFGHPVSGLSREGFTHARRIVTTGGTGFGMITIMVGADRGFVSREDAAERLLKMVRYHGVWSHWLDGATGETIHFATERDNGGDIVETSFLIQGMLTVRQYFDRDNPVENELRERITRLWREIEWDWYLKDPGNYALYWHWSPDHGWAMNHRIYGFNECHVTYLLAMASPTHPIPIDSYYRGWAAGGHGYANGETYYGITKPVGQTAGGPLFFTHYSYLGVNPRALTDHFTNYFVNNRNTTLINRAYCIDNPNGHAGYGPDSWGLTSSQNPDGYEAHAPQPSRDDGTIAPTAAVSAIPYTPAESIAAIKHFYYDLGPKIWGPVGFHDAFNLDRDWVSPSFLAIDQGPMAPMIENHLTGLPWKMFMSSPEADAMLEALDRANREHAAQARR